MAATRTSHRVNAPRAEVYRALIDADAVARWRAPEGMTSVVHALDARERGAFRVSLTYEQSTGRGKTTARTDTYHGHFAKLTENQQVVEVCEFETEDPLLRGEMTITTTLTDADGATDIVIEHAGLPPGISTADNERGTRMSLEKLAALLEGRSGLELVEIGALTERDWAELVAGEEQPFGAVGARLEWLEKERHLALRSSDGRLIGAAGATIATVEAAGEPFEVVGIGGVIVTRSARGRGLMGRLVEPLLARAAAMGPARAMLFCRRELVGLYETFDFAEIGAPVWVDQPDGRREMPLPAMWRALHPTSGWPPGRVEVRGLPF